MYKTILAVLDEAELTASIFNQLSALANAYVTPLLLHEMNLFQTSGPKCRAKSRLGYDTPD